MHNENLILKLHEIESVKFGEFTLKSGIVSPVYIDLRMTVSYPKVLEAVADAIYEKIDSIYYDLLCGVPYTALPIATAISLKHNEPMILRRKEAKGHGTKKIIEGKFVPDQVCMVIEDLVTSAASIFETIDSLEAEGLVVTDAAVLIDREQGGRYHLNEHGYSLHAAITLSEILDTLQRHEKIDAAVVQKVKTFISLNQTAQPSLKIANDHKN